MKNFFYISLVLFAACKQDVPLPQATAQFKTKHVFVVVMDGARYTETWGDPALSNIPNIRNLASQGVMCTNFYNQGKTVTIPGHTAITTGNYQLINNAGQEIPDNPSFFQYYLSQHSRLASDAWVIASKDKIEVLSDCIDPAWAGKSRPRTDCGQNGLNTGYREDSVTYRHLIDTISKYHPSMVLVNFKEPDASGHANNWPAYIQQMKNVDQYIGGLWSFIQSDSTYAGTTTLLVTNDHGRHTDGVYDGFVSHWCDCLGCRHIFLLGVGPDLKAGHIETQTYSLIDIPATICRLMGINMPHGQGQVMHTILK